jgi:anaerobic magnesium-protoporphyrin IX monomethyl ester cyclase
LNPPFHPRYSRSQRSPAVIKSGVIYYPIWLAYATGVLEQDGFVVRLVDAPAAGYDLPDVLGLADELQPRLVVIDTSTPSIHNDVAVAEAIRSRVPDAFILLVGPHVTALPEESLQISSVVDAVARGEYDHTVRDVARMLEGGGALDIILGLSYRDSDGTCVHTPDRPLIQDLDGLPFVSEVYKRHLRVEDYFYSIARYPEMTIVTGRGCPCRCTYCLWPQTITGHQYRQRGVANVADEFEFIAREFPQVREIFIEDDTFTVNQGRCVALAKELIRRGNRLPFTANSRADVSYETLSWLKRAGLRLLCVGFESGDQAVLNGLRKGIQVEQFYRFREDARRAGVLVHGCFMAGGPGETRESLARTLELAKALTPDTAQFFPLMVYPGTEAYEWARHNGYLTTDDFREWLTLDGLHRTVVEQPELAAEELVSWCDQARRSFYLRPRYIAAKVWQILTRPAEAGRILRAARVFSRYLLRPSSPTAPGRREPTHSSVMGHQSHISVIVPAYQAEGTIDRCLEALAHQTIPRESYEVIVVNDGSSDGTSARVKTHAGVYLLTQVHAGPAAARNLGVAHARGEIVLFTDADCEPTPDWIERLVTPFCDGEVVGVKGTYLTRQREIVARFVQLEYEDKYDRMAREQYIDFVDTYSAGYRRDVFEANGGFDPAFPVASVEDQEFSFRLAHQGYNMVFVPQAIVYHWGHARTVWAYWRRKFKIGYWKTLVHRQHPDKLLRDSHTPQILKAQILLVGLGVLCLVAEFLWPPLRWGVATSGLLFFLTTLPFVFKAWGKEPLVALISPGLLFVRALALGTGFAAGLLTHLGFKGRVGTRGNVREASVARESIAR